MEIDDEVLEESDVYLSKTISSNLHIFQYSAKSCDTFDREEMKVKVRPNHRIFEMEGNLDTNSPNFDRRKSELFALNLENESKSDEKHNMSNNNNIKRLLNKQTLKSCEVKPTLSQYCIAIIRNDCKEIHLNPINSVIQLKPSFHYFDKNEINLKKPKLNSKDESEEEVEEESDEHQNEVQTIAMRFAGPDEERLSKAREKSFNYLQQKVAQDPWLPLNYHPINSEFSSSEKMSLIYNSSQDMRNDSNSDNNTSIASLEDFLLTMKYSSEADIETKSSSELYSCSPSLSQIRGLPLADQVRLLLINAKMLSFDQMLELLMGKFESDSVLKNVQMYALLVQGNWIVKSEVLYNKDKCPTSPLTGIPHELLCRARDLIIWKFTQTKHLIKNDIFDSHRHKIPDEDIVDILSQMALFDRIEKRWTFLLPEDRRFIEKYPQVVQRQELLWKHRFQAIERAYNNVIIKAEESQPTIKATQRKRRNSRKSSINSNSTDDNEGNDSSTFDPLLNATNCDTSCSLSVTKVKNERKSPVKTITNRKLSSPATVKQRRRSKTHKMAVFEVNPTVSLHPTPEEKKVLVKCVYEKLKNSFCATSTDLRRYICDNTFNKLWFSVSEEVIESAVCESGGFRVQNKWPQNTPQQPLYAFTKFGDQLDCFRDTLFEMFCDQTRVRQNMFVQKVKDKQLFGDNCEAICLKLLNDYCILRASMYYLKGTVNSN